MFKNNLLFILPFIILLSIFLPVFYLNYAFLDEAHQLWHNQDNSNYTMFFVQGRWLSGILFNTFFHQTGTISGLRVLRIISLVSWLSFLLLFLHVVKQWNLRFVIDKYLVILSGPVSYTHLTLPTNREV